MGNENGTWIMHGLSESDPACIHSAEQLEDHIKEKCFVAGRKRKEEED